MTDTKGFNLRRRRLIAVGLIMMALVFIGIIVAFDDIADRMVVPAPAKSTAIAQSSLSAEEHAFYSFVAPRLAEITAESNRLVQLAEGRSRNLLELQTRSGRIVDTAEAIDAYATDHGVPPRFEDAFSQYLRGISTIRNGIIEARSGFLSFDWDRVAGAVELFSEGAEESSRAFETLQSVGGSIPLNPPTTDPTDQ